MATKIIISITEKGVIRALWRVPELFGGSMRKILSILLVAVLAAGTTFAAFSGEASLGFGGNLDTGEFGFIDQAAKVKVDVDLATASAEEIAEGEVYASIKATLAIKAYSGEKAFAENEGYPWNSKAAIGILADITEAKVAGENWYVSILGLDDAPNYAKSFQTYTVEDGIDKWGFKRDDFKENYSNDVPFDKATGVQIGLYDYKIGFGLVGDYSTKDTWKFTDGLKVAVSAETPEYDFNGVKLQAGTAYSFVDGSRNALDLSAKVGYVLDALTTSAATDLVFDFSGEKAKVEADVAFSLAYDFISADVYYGSNAVTGKTPKAPTTDSANFNKYDKSYSEDMLSAQIKTDLNSFNVPVSLTVAVKDMLAKQDISASVETKPVDGLKVTVSGGYVIDADGRDGAAIKSDKGRDFVGKWSAGLSGEYEMDIFKVEAGVSLEQRIENGAKVVVGGNASIESSALVPGATLKLAWAGDDVTRANSTGYADEDNGDRGKITASCKITF